MSAEAGYFGCLSSLILILEGLIALGVNRKPYARSLESRSDLLPAPSPFMGQTKITDFVYFAFNSFIIAFGEFVIYGVYLQRWGQKMAEFELLAFISFIIVFRGFECIR